MLPTEALIKLNKHKGHLTAEEGAKADSLIVKWRRLHLVRVLALSAATITGLTALVKQ